MNDSKLQRQRFEFKYRITEQKALAMRFFVQSYLDLDVYGAMQPDLSYPVHSIYLDSPSLKTYNDTLNGNRNRYKMRVRYYENGADAPVYLEVKRREDKIITKKRAIVHRWAAQEVLDGGIADSRYLTDPTPEQQEALAYFCSLRNRLNARAKTHISYRREAYESRGSHAARITFDRHVVSGIVPDGPLRFNTEIENPVTVFGPEVILELKFTNRFPEFFKTAVEVYGLRQASAAKYVDGLIELHRNRKVHLTHW